MTSVITYAKGATAYISGLTMDWSWLEETATITGSAVENLRATMCTEAGISDVHTITLHRATEYAPVILEPLNHHGKRGKKGKYNKDWQR